MCLFPFQAKGKVMMIGVLIGQSPRGVEWGVVITVMDQLATASNRRVTVGVGMQVEMVEVTEIKAVVEEITTLKVGWRHKVSSVV